MDIWFEFNIRLKYIFVHNRYVSPFTYVPVGSHERSRGSIHTFVYADTYYCVWRTG